MSERLTYFDDGSRQIAVALPFDLDAWIGEWSGLRSTMIRNCPDAFARDEWAYLITFLDPKALRRMLNRTSASGPPIAAPRLRHLRGREDRSPSGSPIM